MQEQGSAAQGTHARKQLKIATRARLRVEDEIAILSLVPRLQGV